MSEIQIKWEDNICFFTVDALIELCGGNNTETWGLIALKQKDLVFGSLTSSDNAILSVEEVLETIHTKKRLTGHRTSSLYLILWSENIGHADFVNWCVFTKNEFEAVFQSTQPATRH